ncbi:MAG: DUF456 domain-containing protein [Caldilineaceae bacterium]|nr:DUF456 domain-containing protein [Caldilineaceae bacterium]
MQGIDLNISSYAGYLLIGLGLAGAVLPIVPGPLLIWLGAFIWAWGNDFQIIGPLLLVVLGVLALLAWGMDLLTSLAFSRRSGSSWRAVGGAILGGLVGGFLLSGVIPIIGTLAGAFAGSLLGTWLAEFTATRNAKAATKAARVYIASFILSSILEATLSIVMVVIFAWRVWG